MIKAGIIGATGYAGGELVRILLGHKDVEIKWYGSRSYIDKKYADVYRNMFTLVEDVCLDDNIEKLAKEVDVIFTATPQGFLAGVLTEEILKQCKVIDLSADYRIKDVHIYEQWYGIEHKSPQFIEEAVYGLCEINREKTKGKRLVANPGCYTTCSILTAYPLVKEGLIDTTTLIVDAKSGTSGAGRGAKVQNLYCEVNENIKAYGVASHRHTPEIEEQLGYAAGKEIQINFTPHLVPMNRGILVTEYATLNKKGGKLPEELEEFFRNVSWKPEASRLDIHGERVYYMPKGLPKLNGVRFLRTGLLLGELKKKRFEPSQAFAMSLKKEEYANILDLSVQDERVIKYLKGETLDVEDLVSRKEKGWYLVCVDGYPLGFGKLANQTLKNKYLPGWRWQS